MENDSLVRNSLTASLAFGVAAVVSVGATALIVFMFGLGHEADAYFIAIFLPRIIMTIFNGTVPQVLIPAISGAKSEGDEARHSRLVNNILNHGVVVGALVFVALMATAPWVTRLMAPGFDDQTWRLCTDLLRFACIGIPLSFLCEVLGGYLYSRGVFALSSGAESLRAGSVVIALLVLPRSWGIHAAMVGFFVGYILQFLFLRVLAWQKGLRLQFVLAPRDNDFRRVVSALVLPTAGSAVNFSPNLVQRLLASFLPTGAVSAFAIAQQIIGMLFAVTLRSVNVAAHPEVSRHAVNKDVEAMNATLAQSVKLSCLMGSVLCLLTITLSRDSVALVAGLGAFTAESAELLVALLATLAIFLPLSGANQALRLPHYALGNSRIPAIHLATTGIAHIVFQLLLFKPFGVIGIALAQVLWIITAVTIIFILLPAQCKPLYATIWPLIKATLSALALGLGLYFLRANVELDFLENSRLLRAGWLAFEGLCMCAILFVVYKVMLYKDFRDVFGGSSLRGHSTKI